MKVSHLLYLSVILMPLMLAAQNGPEEDQSFSHEIETKEKPWTNRKFLNDPDDFQFAIVTDRTGGMRPGVFPRAVEKVNELQPEFVITVGDLIPGGGRLRDEKEIRRQWDEFNGFVERFEMPFFYLPGNHDVSNAVMDRIWDELFGVRYYSFVYKKVLFLCLNTQDGEGSRPFLGEGQIDWVKEELAKHHEVRWTMVFIHQPLWLTEEGGRPGSTVKGGGRKSVTGWPEVEAALSGRKHTVYAGHVHRYAKYERNEVNYYTLGTTGGGSALRGSTFGEFDHATWITMTDEGPRMMNLTLDGMLKENTTTEAQQKFWRGLKFTGNYKQTYPFEGKVVTLPIENRFDFSLSGELEWILPASDHWTVSPLRASIDLKPGEKTELTFEVSHQGDVSTYFPVPRLDSSFRDPDGSYQLDRGIFLPLDLIQHVKDHPERAAISVANEPPAIDGKLDEKLWKGEPTVKRLIPRKADGYAPVETEAWISYDKSFAYVGVRCHEPVMADVQSEVIKRDDDVREDDSIELLFDTNLDQKSFHHFAVNAKGVLYDAENSNADWNSKVELAASEEEGAWIIEMAIPLADIGGKPTFQKEWGFQMTRHRTRYEERKSYQWSPTFWYGNYFPAFFGKLELN